MAKCNCVAYFYLLQGGRSMRLTVVLSFVLVLALSVSAFAGEITYVGKITSPSSQLRGLESLGQGLFAVSDLYLAGSCMYLIDSQTGAVLRDTCFNDTLPVWRYIAAQTRSLFSNTGCAL